MFQFPAKRKVPGNFDLGGQKKFNSRKKIKMSQEKANEIFPEMPEQPGVPDVPIVDDECSRCPRRTLHHSNELE